MTSAFAEVIGDPISQSKSPIIHQFWLEKAGLDIDYRATQVTRAGPARIPDGTPQR
jgi:shikimate dehydrogenase